MIVNIRNNKPTVSKCVDQVPGLFVSLDSVKISRFPGDPDWVGISGEFPDPSEFDPGFLDD